MSADSAESTSYNHFVHQDFDRAVEALQKIPQRLRGETRVQHNLAVAAFFQGGCVDVKRLLEIFVTLSGTSEDTTDDEEEGAFDLALATLKYNQAVLYHRLRHHSASLEILEVLYRNVEALEEDLALRACLLLTEVHLALRQGAKAAGVLLFVEKTFCSGAVTVNRGSSVGDAANGGPSTMPPSAADGQRSPPQAGGDRPHVSLSPEQLHFMVCLYRVKIQILAQNINAAKKELKKATESMTLLEQKEAGGTAQTSCLWMGGPADQVAFLQAHLEYIQRNYRKSTKLLNTAHKRAAPSENMQHSTSSSSSPPDGLLGLYFNNMGCIHYQLSKYSTAAFQFVKAMREDKAAARNIGRRCEIYYNQGIQLLANGKPALAFLCLLRAADTYHHQPRLWLRLAQCAIAIHMANARNAALWHQKSETIARVVSYGNKERQVLLPVHPPPSSSFALSASSGGKPSTSVSSIPLPVSISEQPPDSSSDAHPAPTLLYSMICLRNAIKLTNRAVAVQTSTTDASTASEGGAPAGAASTRLLEQVCFLDMAYVALALDDPVVALAAAEAVLSNESGRHSTNGNTSAIPMDTEYRLLAHLYAAEAYCLLNRPAEAMQHLSPSLLKEAPSLTQQQSTGSASGPPTQLGLSPTLAASARYVLYINLAVAHILQDKLLPAQKCLLHATATNSSSPHALLLQTYIELARGNTAAALDLLQRHKIVPPTVTGPSGGQQQHDGRSQPTTNK